MKKTITNLSYIILQILIFTFIIYAQNIDTNNTFDNLNQQWQLADGTSGNPIAAISIYQSNPDTIYASGLGHQSGPGSFLSTDNGVYWDTIDAKAPLGFGTDIGALR